MLPTSTLLKMVSTVDFRVARNSGVSDTSCGSGRDELLTPNGVVRNCWLLVIGSMLFLGKIDHDDLGVLA